MQPLICFRQHISATKEGEDIKEAGTREVPVSFVGIKKDEEMFWQDVRYQLNMRVTTLIGICVCINGFVWCFIWECVKIIIDIGLQLSLIEVYQ